MVNASDAKAGFKFQVEGTSAGELGTNILRCAKPVITERKLKPTETLFLPTVQIFVKVQVRFLSPTLPQLLKLQSQRDVELRDGQHLLPSSFISVDNPIQGFFSIISCNSLSASLLPGSLGVGVGRNIFCFYSYICSFTLPSFFQSSSHIPTYGSFPSMLCHHHHHHLSLSNHHLI